MRVFASFPQLFQCTLTVNMTSISQKEANTFSVLGRNHKNFFIYLSLGDGARKLVTDRAVEGNIIGSELILPLYIGY